MTAPTPAVRAVMLERDNEQCVACPTTVRLEAQHRQAVGMGGSGRRPGFVELVTACQEHNARFESDLQTRALAHGWKVRKWVADPGQVPVFYVRSGWHRLTDDGMRIPISGVFASTMMRAVYGDEWDQWRAAA